MPYFLTFFLCFMVVFPVISFIILDSSRGGWLAGLYSFFYLMSFLLFLGLYTNYLESRVRADALLTQESCEPCYETCPLEE